MSRWLILPLMCLSLSGPLWAEDVQTGGTESEPTPQPAETTPPPADKKPKPAKADEAEPDCD